MMLKRVFLRFSHVGRRPITIEPNVNVELLPVLCRERVKFGMTESVQTARISGPLGTLEFPIRRGLRVAIASGPIAGEQLLKVDIDQGAFEKMSKYCQKFVKSMWGTTASTLRQHVEGVSEGYQVPLKLVGVGFKASVEDDKINLKVGYTHAIPLPIPAGIKVTIPIQTKVVISGSNLQQVTQFAAKIRSFRKPEPYNGRGIFVGNETITLKEGKKK